MKNIDFFNTAIAFSGEKNSRLKLKAFMFSILFTTFFIKLGKIAISLKILPKFIIKPLIFNHFCAGETLEQTNNTVNNLSKYKVKSILDYSVENETSAKNINNTYNEIIKTIEIAKNNNFIPFAVFKPSSLINYKILEKISDNINLTDSEIKEYEIYKSLIYNIANKAIETNHRVLIDAEDFSFQKAVDDISLELMQKYNKKYAVIYNTFQMYRNDRLKYLNNCITLAQNNSFTLGAKIVRGAYMEKERKRALEMNYLSPINPNKESTDKMFDSAIQLLINNIASTEIFCGTHNEKSCNYLVELMHLQKIDANDYRIWFSQLYGMSNHISFNLAANGYNVAKYIPYGPVKSVIPYLIRRAEENSAAKGQSSRELELIKIELKRRKNK